MKLLFRSHVIIWKIYVVIGIFSVIRHEYIYQNFSQAQWTQTVNGTFSEKTLGLNMMFPFFCGEIC